VAEPREDWPVAPPSPEELPAGEYLVAYRNARRFKHREKEKVELSFEIIEPVLLAGALVPLFKTLPSGRLTQRHAYYPLWCCANGGPPKRGDRMTPRVFSGYWRVLVEWSKPKEGGAGQPVIRALIERVAGGPKR
jgi:hypothetical protein